VPKVLFAANVSLFFSKFLFPLADHFRRKGWQVDGAAPDATKWPPNPEHFDRLFDIKWSRNPLDPKNLLLGLREIQQLVEREGYDIVHVHTPVPAFIARLALREVRYKTGTKLIYTAHGFHFHPAGNPLSNAIFLNLERLAGRWTDHLVVMNREDEAAARQYHIVPPGRLHYMPGIGLDLSRYTAEAVPQREVEAVRAELGLTPDQPLFSVVAEFIPRKRHQDALEAFARLAHPTARLALAGSGRLEPELRALVRKLGLEERVLFLGWRQDVPAIIKASLATLLPTQQEGLPRSVMESLCLGVPVIGTNIRGVHELLHNDCGFLLPVGDVAAITSAMRWVLEHPAEAKAMGRKGCERMKAYDIRNILHLHEQLYAKALGKNSERSPNPEASHA